MGGAGNDTVDGGAGADTIRFGSVLVSGTAGDAAAGGGVSASVGADTLAFSPDDDTFELSETIFGALGNGGSGVGAALNANQFATVSGIGDALNGTLDTTGNGAIVYDAGNRALYFLEAGASNTATLQTLLTAGAAVKIADITTPAITITAADFMVIA
jgi:Ca2+-binding RTX toxin-like protein